MSAHPQQKRLAIAAADSPVRLYSTDDAALLREVAVRGSGVVDLQFSPSGRTLAIVERDGSVQLVDLDGATAAPIRIRLADDEVSAIAFRPDEEGLLVGRRSGVIQLAELKRGEVGVALETIADVPRAIVECPESGIVAVGTDSGRIHLIDLEGERPTASMRAHTGRINVLCVMPDGRSIVSGGRDRELRLWDTQAAEMVTTLPGHARQVFALAVSPDGQTLISGDLDGVIRLWRAPR
jgi:WD40 repeat protein